MATRQHTNQTSSHFVDPAAAAKYATTMRRMAALMRESEAANATSLPDELPVSEHEKTPQSTAPSASAAPEDTGPASPSTDSPSTAPTQPSSSEPPTPDNPPSAVVLCSKAYNQAYNEGKEKHHSDYDCKKAAERAYLNEIPNLHKPENINDFIACVAYAMLINIIPPANGTKILYAAQIATQAGQAAQAAQARQASNKIANRDKLTTVTPK